MIWIFWTVAIWISIGWLAVALDIFNNWRHGKDLTLGDLLLGLVIGILGPLFLLICFYVLIRDHQDLVILPGSKSAKVYKSLTSDECD